MSATAENALRAAPEALTEAPSEALAPATAGAALLASLQQGPLSDEKAGELAEAFAGIARTPSRQAADLLLEAISRRELRLYRHQGTTLHTRAVEALLVLVERVEA
jgi:hypothetical protein